MQNVQGKKKQHGVQHYGAGKIYTAMGDTLPSVATLLSMADNNHSM